MSLAAAKTALRISEATTAFDSEIMDLIAAAKADLELAGVSATRVNDAADALIKRAVITYCKAHFGWNNPDAERLAEAYRSIKAHLTLSADYTAPTGEAEA